MRVRKREGEHAKNREGEGVRAESKRDPSLIIHIKPTEHLAAQSFMPHFFNVFIYFLQREITFMKLNGLSGKRFAVLFHYLFIFPKVIGKWVDEGGSKYRKLIYIVRQHLGRRWGVWGGQGLRRVTQE